MKFSKLKIFPGWRIASFLALSVFLCGCSPRVANMTKGSFEIDLPKPVLGAGIYIFPDELHVRGTMSYNTGDKETLAMEGMKNGASSQFPEEPADIDLTLQRHPLSGTVDIFYKLRQSQFTFGGNLSIDPNPSANFFLGINGLYGECGYGVRLDYLKAKASYSGHYVYMTDNFLTREAEGDFDETHDQWNVNFGLFFFSGFFVTSNLSINFSTGLYMPTSLEEVYLDKVEYPGDYDVMMDDIPLFFSQYVGMTMTLLDRVQMRAGEMVYYTPYSDNLIWQTHFSVSFFIL